MDTPAQTPSPTKQKLIGIANKANKIIPVIAIIIFALIYFGQKSMMGKKYKVSDKESVNYTDNATEADAKMLAEVLKADGIFSGKKEMDVLLKKNDKEGIVVSFVGSWDAKDETITKVFHDIGEEIAAKGFGKPLTIRLLDTHLNKKGEIKVE